MDIDTYIKRFHDDINMVVKILQHCRVALCNNNYEYMYHLPTIWKIFKCYHALNETLTIFQIKPD